MKRSLFCLLGALLLWACKGTPEDEITERPTNTKLSYKALNVSIDFLQYNHPFELDLNSDSQIDYVLSSVLLEENDLPYLYLFINRKTPHLNRFVVKNAPELVNGGFWAVPLEKNAGIGSNMAAGNQWSPDLSSGCFISSSSSGTTTNFAGEWIGKKDKYLGLKFLINGAYHYGWLRVSHTSGEDKIAILDYAYNKEAGKEIIAGEK
jgi:hypothetical protein